MKFSVVTLILIYEVSVQPDLLSSHYHNHGYISKHLPSNHGSSHLPLCNDPEGSRSLPHLQPHRGFRKTGIIQSIQLSKVQIIFAYKTVNVSPSFDNTS